MSIGIDKECSGYKYTDGSGENGDGWSVTTDYLNDNIYQNAPDDEADVDVIRAYAKALARACTDMKADMKGNVEEI